MEFGSGAVVPKEQIVVAMVQLLNLDAQSVGVNGKITPRALKTMLKLRNRSLGRPSFLVVHQGVAKGRDSLYLQFDVDKITQIRSNFVSEGMATIHASNTAIMIKQAKPAELGELLIAIALGQRIASGSIPPTLRAQDEGQNPGPPPSVGTMGVKGQSAGTESRSGSMGSSSSGGGGAGRRKSTGSGAFPSTTIGSVVLSSGSSSRRSTGSSGGDGGRKTVQISKSTISRSSSSLSGPLQQSRLNFQTQAMLAEKYELSKKDVAALRRLVPKEVTALARLPNKRPRSPSPPNYATPEDTAAFKRFLKTKGKDVVVKIKSKLAYLQHGFTSANPTHLTISAIALKRLDSRLLSLNSLRHLDLSNNALSNVDALRNLPTPLETLKLAHNLISSLDSRLRFAWRGLTLLDLSYNKLKVLPESLVYLQGLRSLDISNNELRVLPYNLHLMGSLRTLLVHSNQLQCLPHPLSLGLGWLTRLDIAGNPGLKKPPILPIAPLRPPGWGSSLHEPSSPSSLLELCAKTVLATSNRTETAFAKLTEGAIPESVMEYLYRAKRCGTCRQLVTRYCFKDSFNGIPRSIAEEIVCDGPADAVRAAYCPHHLTP